MKPVEQQCNGVLYWELAVFDVTERVAPGSAVPRYKRTADLSEVVAHAPRAVNGQVEVGRFQ
jgi:hypothetical protein